MLKSDPMRQLFCRCVCFRTVGIPSVLTRHTIAPLLQGRRTPPHVDTTNQGSSGSLQSEVISARTNILTPHEHQRILCSSFAYLQDPSISQSHLSIVQLHFITPSHILCPVTQFYASSASSNRNRYLPFHAYPQKNVRPIWCSVCLWVPRFAFSNYGIPSPRFGYGLSFSLLSVCFTYQPISHVRCTFKIP
jgi:hypothetical protein